MVLVSNKKHAVLDAGRRKPTLAGQFDNFPQSPEEISQVENKCLRMRAIDLFIDMQMSSNGGFLKGAHFGYAC